MHPFRQSILALLLLYAPAAFATPSIVGVWKGVDDDQQEVNRFDADGGYSITTLWNDGKAIKVWGRYTLAMKDTFHIDLSLTPTGWRPTAVCANPADRATCHPVKVVPEHVLLTMPSDQEMRFVDNDGPGMRFTRTGDPQPVKILNAP